MKKFILILLISFNTSASVNFHQFVKLKDALHLAFTDIRPNSDQNLFINLLNGLPENYWWDLDIVHASYSNLDKDHNIFLFGGFARLEGMSLDGLAITACHEMGHGIGGAPYKDSGSSAEGQSDYYATKICLPAVFKYLEQTTETIVSDFNIKFCEESKDYDYCMRALTALESNIFFFETLGDIVHFETPSTNIALELNTSPTYYPSSQCRLDTSLNGILHKERPRCWYPE